VRGVEGALARLRPVALLELLRDEAVRRRQQRELDVRQRRLLPGGPEIGPHEVAPLARRIRAGTHLVAEAALGGHRRHVHAAPVHVELPAVVGAAQAALLVPAEEQVGAAVRTHGIQQTHALVGVTERDEVFAEDLHAHGRAVTVGELLGEEDGLPEAAEEIAHRGPGAGAGEDLVVFRAQHGHHTATDVGGARRRPPTTPAWRPPRNPASASRRSRSLPCRGSCRQVVRPVDLSVGIA
jgi:hypothetical protein